MPNVRPKDIPTTASYPAPDDWEILDGTVNGTRKLAASYRDTQIMTRAPGSYLQSSGVSGSGIVYTGGSRQNIAGVPVVEIAFEGVVPTAVPSSASCFLWTTTSSATPSNSSAQTFFGWLTTTGSLRVQANGATAADQRIFQWAGFLSAYLGQRIRGSIVLTQGTTNPVVRINGVDVSSSFTLTTAGTPPDWLDASLATAFQVTNFNLPAQECFTVTPILGSLSTTERDTWFTTGRFPAWVHAGGSAVGLLTNTGFEVDTSGWAAQSGGTFTRITSDFQSGVACAEIVAASSGQGIRTDAGAISTDNALMCGFWAKSVSGNTSLTLSRGNGGNPVAFALTSSWQFFVYATNSVATNVPSTGTNYVGFTLGGAGTFRLDNVQVWRAGALTLPGVQGIGTVRDLTTIGGNQGRLVGIRPCLALPAPRNIAILPLSTTGAFLTLASTNPLAFSPQRIMRAEVVVDTAGADLTFRNNSSSTNNIVTALTDIPSANTATALTLIAAQTRLAAGATVWGSLSAGTGQLIIELADTL